MVKNTISIKKLNDLERALEEHLAGIPMSVPLSNPLCIIETTQVEIVPYEEVNADFAAVEGEGDGSLRYWREVHW